MVIDLVIGVGVVGDEAPDGGVGIPGGSFFLTMVQPHLLTSGFVTLPHEPVAEVVHLEERRRDEGGRKIWTEDDDGENLGRGT